MDGCERLISHAGREWRILSAGLSAGLSDDTFSADGVLCRLVSTTEFEGVGRQRKPLQVKAYVAAREVEKVLGRPRDFFAWNRSLRGAFERGMRDAAAGRRRDECPYADTRKANGRLTWSRAYRAAWLDGFAFHQRATETSRMERTGDSP